VITTRNEDFLRRIDNLVNPTTGRRKQGKREAKKSRKQNTQTRRELRQKGVEAYC
jgi:hypothetical protein